MSKKRVVAVSLMSLWLGCMANGLSSHVRAEDVLEKLKRERIQAMREQVAYLKELAEQLHARVEYEEEKRVREKASELKHKATKLEQTEWDEELEDE